MTPIDKILGADIELGIVFERAGPVGAASQEEAAIRLLAEIDGVPSHAGYVTNDPRAICDPYEYEAAGDFPTRMQRTSHASAGAYPYNPQDRGRKFLASNGGCYYIDLGHPEGCIPEVRSARDFVAHVEALYARARDACARANAKLPSDERIVVMANNSDRMSHSWGGHLNVLISRELYSRIFDRLYPELFVLAAYQVSSILFTGQGKVGSENGKPRVAYQLTQRGDFCECLEGVQTTYRRPIVNSRDEAHCGQAIGNTELARLHVIFYDSALMQASNFLKAGVMQLILALMESGWCERGVLLADPLAALTQWGHDPTLCATARLDDGRSITAIDHQYLFLDAVQRFVASGDISAVPEADAIVALWEDTLHRLQRRDFAILAKRLDWVLKYQLLQRLERRDPKSGFDAPSLRAADLLYANLDPRGGLYMAIAGSGGIETIVTAEAIARALDEPPQDTRAWSRAMLLRHFGARGVLSVNWDEIRLAPASPNGHPTVIRLDDPRRFTRAEIDAVADDAAAGSRA